MILKKRQSTGLLLIMLFGLALRLIALDQSLWLDEGIEWWGVTTFGLRKLLTGYMLGDFNPPGHHILMWFWVRIFGDSEIALRMPSVLFGVGTVWMTYLISCILERPGPGVRQGQAFSRFAAILAATNGLLIYYSQEARMYAMATFFVTATVWAFLKLQNFFSIQMLTTYYLLLTTALYSHYLTWLMIPVFVVGAMREMGVVRRMRYAIPLLATIPLWPLLVKQLQNGIASAGNSQWAMLSQTTPKNIALVFVKFVTGRVPFPDETLWQLVVGALVVLFWVGVTLGAVRVVREMRERKRMWEDRGIILLWATIPLILVGIIGLVIPVFSYFRFLFVLPAVLLLFVWGTSGWNVWGVGVLRVFGVAVFLPFSLFYLLSPSNHRENWRGAVASIRDQSESPVVLIHPAVRPPLDYYDRGRSVVISSEDVFRHQIPVTSNQLWNLPYAQPIFDSDDSVRNELKRLDFSRVFERHFNGITIEEWRKFRLPDRPKFLKL